ncbi:hypothetical protein Pmar_PMAR004185 [Perkinsus marinus ATCC 50983]|uniref:EF-hand domain-containing protein n=1 Tax=Perkinsus marinus (strain ATCC 50983 / TXsc) TaxID=423536 RepID=C5LPJ2_PERM5|nr:hypothetical protein Pmar_PMAR004185 [Perkinsus marinus ATCC 50983]EER01312.1 hypothetical protein Pmar_PMAR004185 [Perkinsus marinus ATCC 50983]|mmetsp:Transcript_26468/g.26150  ORF Transcript_26468/g.26150 Transcript_26468/m.26150 type:complete len:94 (+) Transcript_26468:41-322(+)|eukprot:XP_002768594.1 hypothetical protein Pmar_PMAR004185 [Perkinsus marinus ATCC 50983]
MHSPLYLSSILLSIVTAVHATVRDVDAQTMGRFDDQMHEMDLDGNGRVDAQEIRSIFLDMSDSFVDRFMRNIDQNQDGSFSRDEYFDYAFSED